MIDVDRSLGFDYFYGIESEQFSFIRLPKLLFRDRHFKGLSLEAKVVYGLLLDRMSLSLKNSWIDEENRVYIIYTVSSIAEDVGCSKDKASRILAELDSVKGIGLVERKRRGLGRPDIIYVKNFVKFMDTSDDGQKHDVQMGVDTAASVAEDHGFSGEPSKTDKSLEADIAGNEVYRSIDNISKKADQSSFDNAMPQNPISANSNLPFQETADHDFKKPQNKDSADRNLRLQEAAKIGSNNTDINKTEYSDTSLFLEGSSRQVTLVDKRNLIGEDEEVIRQIKENILYDWHMQTDMGSDRELYHELYEVIKDMVIGERETVTIGKATYPYDYVRKRYMSLNHEHLEYARDEVVKNKGKIYCLRKFMETALFNAPTTMNTHYSQLYTYYEEGEGRQIWDAG